MFDVVERIGLRKFVFPDFAPTGQPYDSPGQRPGLSREVGPHPLRCFPATHRRSGRDGCRIDVGPVT